MLYIHIPFCKSRCIYCSFFSSTGLEKREQYVSAIEKEISQRVLYLPNNRLSSIYFGGGTPSVLGEKDFVSIFQTIEQYFSFDSNTEITIECNPDDITPDFVDTLRRLPFNRVSFGVQSFSDDELKFLGRRHTSKQSHRAVELLQKAGVDDIIY